MMNNDMEYKEAIAQAEANLADARERGEEALGDWEDLRAELFTPEEIAASNARVAIISELIKARNDKKISQQEFEELSGERQPVISHIETDTTNSQLDNILKVLGELGKTLYVGDIPKEHSHA